MPSPSSVRTMDNLDQDSAGNIAKMEGTSYEMDYFAKHRRSKRNAPARRVRRTKRTWKQTEAKIRKIKKEIELLEQRNQLLELENKKLGLRETALAKLRDVRVQQQQHAHEQAMLGVPMRNNDQLLRPESLADAKQRQGSSPGNIDLLRHSVEVANALQRLSLQRLTLLDSRIRMSIGIPPSTSLREPQEPTGVGGFPMMYPQSTTLFDSQMFAGLKTDSTSNNNNA